MASFFAGVEPTVGLAGVCREESVRRTGAWSTRADLTHGIAFELAEERHPTVAPDTSNSGRMRLQS